MSTRETYGTLPDDVRRFSYASAEAGERHTRTHWGVVQTDSRYPRIFDANNATVLERRPGLTAAEIRRDLLPALQASGATVEHVEFWETSVRSSAFSQLAGTGDERQRGDDVVMVWEGAREGAQPRSVTVDVIGDPDQAFWPWYRESLTEFGGRLDDEVLDQLVARVRDVFLPYGMHWFVGLVDGERAGYTSLVSLDGVGYIDNVVTFPDFRRRGVASATVLAAIERSRAAGNRSLFLLAERGQAPQLLYERLGFRVRGVVESFTRHVQEA
jgi:ribosomal protein S18 acetylase RimI-like enzyme